MSTTPNEPEPQEPNMPDSDPDAQPDEQQGDR